MGQDVDDLGESVQDAGGTEAPPSAAVSPEPEVQPTSLEAEGTLETAEERITRLEAYVRSLQGDKDRGVNKALEGVDQLKERFNGFEKYAKMRKDGKTAEEAQREMVITEIVDERIGTQVVQEPVGSQAVEPSGFDADKFLREQGIDPNSAEALTLIRDGKTNVVDYFNLALGKKDAPVTEPNLAQVMPTGSGSSVGGRDIAEVETDLDKLNVKTGKTREDWAKIREYKEEHQNLLKQA